MMMEKNIILLHLLVATEWCTKQWIRRNI